MILSPKQFIVLEHLIEEADKKENGKVPQATVRVPQFTEPALKKALQSLTKKGMIEKQHILLEMRAVNILITDKAKEYMRNNRNT